ncbi:DUF4238 domain-containing protein [Rufibacter sediminis]|uniref:DUF4238 domain-containing protein n=1 Tax=Rufibacter sediminis TaxID=2762756 RepID=A0ABR6VV31_9BACT|nr:DUF4238 domain-containing protein [Rufibacter sediminis]MBC3540471.1 DUF4238 domain-containing protein [Rufibacter sediminis]
MAQSQRHHYIPQFLIKGFVGEDKKVAVYNIEKKKLEPYRKSPSQVFFEWNRNSFDINGEVTDFIEGSYQFSESIFAPVYRKILEQPGPIVIDTYELLQLILFIGELHWRVPDRDEEMETFMQHATKKDLLISIRNKKNGEEAPQDIYDRLMKEPAFRQGSKIIKSIHDYLKADIISSIDNWKIYYSSNNIQLHLLSDNPLIIRDIKESNIYKNELIFPLSKGKTVFHTNGRTVKVLPPEHRLSIDLLIFLQAKKMVCGPNSEYLNHIAHLAELYKSDNHVQLLKEQIFKVFE